MYNSETGTFFTPMGELGLTLHEMYEVSVLLMGEVPYEEHIPTIEELHRLRAKNERIYETYWRGCATIVSALTWLGS